MSQEYRRGPTDETNREVARKASFPILLIVVGFPVAYYNTGAEAVGALGLLMGIGGLALAGEHVGEGLARLRLWWDTRRYADE
jgi:hypothetical protein